MVTTLYRGIPLRDIRPLPRPRMLFPNEHGAWTMFWAAFLLGWLGAPELSWRPLLILPAAIGAFLTRYPIGIIFKKRRVTRALKIPLTREKQWCLIYSLATLIVAFPLFYPLGWWWLSGFALPSILSLGLHLRAIIRRKERTLFVESTAMLGLSFLCPAAAYASVMQLRAESAGIWLLLVGYNFSRITRIWRKVAHKREEPIDLRSLGKREIYLSGLFLILVIVVVRIAHVPFVP